MKKLLPYVSLMFFALPAFSQYYMRGEIKDEKNQPLPNAKIFVHSAKAFYYSGASYGSFGITMRNLYDSLTITLDGYETKSIRVKTDIWQNIVLKISAADASKNKPKLISVTKDLKQSSKLNWFTGDETYFQLVENEFVNAAGYPNTGFSLNVNKASYSNVRRFINGESPVPPDAVKVEELINYFNLHYRQPKGNDIFRIESQLTSCPWNIDEQLLFLNISARKLDLNKIPPGNFVFLIDVSGSMDMPNRLPLLKAAFQLFVKNLRAIDKVSIVTYGGNVAVWLQPTSGADKDTIMKSIEELEAAGDTPGESAIRMAYKVAQSTFINGGNNRVILATDGDFNVGENTEKSLDELITKQRQTGVYLTCLGVGMGNFKDSKLQTLAKKGNGNYAYLDDINEAEKVLVKELTQTFFSVADDVFMNVQFNPSMVKQYRLIGFDNKKEALSDFSNDLEGGEIGSGNSTLAVFQILPTQQNLLTKNTTVTDDIAKLDLKYRRCNDSLNQKLTFDVKNNYAGIDSVDRELKFAAAVTMFALKLKQSRFLNDADWDFIIATAKTCADKTNYLQNQFLVLLDKAQKIYDVKKKKKRKSVG
ncbi:MAG: von Willebrand factor type A domain-containing protein [Ferruginibacter sp.]|nr:von Willebrand factor type A domain-containing protein [Ferruginibacter sp.]